MPSIPLTQLQPIRQRVTCLLACAWLLALLCPIGVMAAEATPLESIQIMTGNYRKGPNVGGIGHLGGVPVSIPKEFAHFVEYDGDPGFLEKRKGPKQERTFETGIRSFGFEIRYPDMVPENDQNWVEKRKENIHTTLWLNVTVLSNANYHIGDQDKMAHLAQARLRNASVYHRYERSHKNAYGLTLYVPTNVDLSRRELSSSTFRDGSDRNIYVHYFSDGDVDAIIDCSNMNHDAAQCIHRFDLAPKIKASVDVSYRKGLLPHWREIQDGVSKVLLGFRIDPSKASPTSPKSSQLSPSQTQE